MGFSDEQWIGRRGKIAHPDSPAGMGGPGRARSARCYGRDCDSLAPYPDPRSPKGRNVVPEYLDVLDDEDILFADLSTSKKNKLKQRTKKDKKEKQSQPKVQDKRKVAEKKKAKRKKPPKTNPKKYKISSYLSGDVYVEILADNSSSDKTMVGAKTNYDLSSIKWSLDNIQHDGKKITSFTFKISGSIKIQTTYGPGANAKQASLYGRGTTADDIAKGNVTLGFHEYCHRIDFYKYFMKNPPPEFPGKKGMAISEWTRVTEKFKKDIQAYFDKNNKDKVKSPEAEKQSYDNTDEVGYKKSQCQSDGKCK